jgi:hypothetical protein
VQLVTQGEVLEFQNRPTAESAGKNRADGTHELKHAGNTTAARLITRDFSARSEFLVATGRRIAFQAKPHVRARIALRQYSFGSDDILSGRACAGVVRAQRDLGERASVLSISLDAAEGLPPKRVPRLRRAVHIE